MRQGIVRWQPKKGNSHDDVVLPRLSDIVRASGRGSRSGVSCETPIMSADGLDATAWWRRGVIYQIYPRSFLDSDGDGIGDLEGIRRRLDHLVWLGVAAVWISPFFPSPMKDFGYDIRDFCDVDPVFGDLATFDRLLAEAHGRGLKVILDLVPNHTSDQHPWFIESGASRDNPKRDWYVWRDPQPDGSPPNGWVSTFGGSGWERDDRTGQFYYHAFLKEQPDLNWRNEDVQAAMHDVMRFWLARGVDGFRVDAITYLVEDDLLREDPPDHLAGEGAPKKAGVRHVFTADRPETHDCVSGLRRVVDAYPDRVLIGEAHLPVALVMRYYGWREPGFHLPFNFILLHTTWDARTVEAAIDQYLNLMPEGCWPNWVLGNHDEPRIATRIGEEEARVAAMLIMTVGGTPFVYNGEELGLGDVVLAPDQVQDTPERRNPGRGLGRDPQRSPMPWDGSPEGGFTSGEPWLPIGDTNRPRNVEAQRADPRSVLNLYRRLIALRTSDPALIAGHYVARAERGPVLAYIRRGDARDVFVVLNFGDAATAIDLPGPGRIALSTHLDRDEAECDGTIELRAREGLVVRLSLREETAQAASA